MNWSRNYAILAILFFFAAAFVTAQEKGTPAEAQALVEKAIEYLKVNGPEKAFAAFSDPKGKFVDRDLYVLAYDMDGKCLAHGQKKERIGVNQIESKDADGKYFIKERIFIAKQRGKGWQNYKWENPVTKKIDDKTMYIVRVGDVIIGCGAYGVSKY